ncbi:MAG: hypothetical protein NWE93_01620 [Candidatus Bathyarchaeota archaeon]|nr:hypothetical protein [Candidatus Bathyarchaeota archaeon]
MKKLTKSVKHLQTVDKVFSEQEHDDKELYLYLRKRLNEADSFALQGKIKTKLSEELYVGGKTRSYGRQMILSDVITYIIAGRAYFYATRSKESMQSFIETVLLLTNQLMLFDSLTVNAPLRKKVLEELESSIGQDYIKDDEREEENEALKAYNGAIGLPLEQFEPSAKVIKLLSTKKKPDQAINEAHNRLAKWYDSLLPKQVGLWGELLVYAYLLRQKVGYVWPLLLTQELISGDYDNSLKVPDYVIVPFNFKDETFAIAAPEKEEQTEEDEEIEVSPRKKAIGVEVGGGKETQSTRFSNLTGITIATKSNADNPKRCPICGKWILFCPVVIGKWKDLDFHITHPSEPLNCIEKCTIYKPEEIRHGDCPYASVNGIREPKTHIMHLEYDAKLYHFHLACALKDKNSKQDVRDDNTVTYYPYIKGLEEVEDLISQDQTHKIQELEETIKKLEEQLAEKSKEE